MAAQTDSDCQTWDINIILSTSCHSHYFVNRCTSRCIQPGFTQQIQCMYILTCVQSLQQMMCFLSQEEGVCLSDTFMALQCEQISLVDQQLYNSSASIDCYWVQYFVVYGLIKFWPKPIIKKQKKPCTCIGHTQKQNRTLFEDGCMAPCGQMPLVSHHTVIIDLLQDPSSQLTRLQ